MTELAPNIIPPRHPNQVMKLARMGSFHQCRLSFMRTLLRRLKSEQWRFEQARFDIDAQGVGTALYCAHGPDRSYTLVAFANDLPPEKRSDRVIATEWDATFTLFDGIPTDADVDRLRANVPLQEAGRITESELSLSRANRSVRLWEHVVDRLAAGQQPDTDLVQSVGYLMRTTAVYGSAKFGAADREVIADRPEFSSPFQVEMLSVFLTRSFVMDLVEHMARAKSPDAVPLNPALRRTFGIGNSTGLGMAPFLLHHPQLLNNWIAAKEEALARIRSLRAANADAVATFMGFIPRAMKMAAIWRSEHPLQIQKLAALNTDVATLQTYLQTFDFNGDHPWNRLYEWAETKLSIEGQELLVSLMMEPYGDLIDGLTGCMAADESIGHRIDGTVSLGDTITQLQHIYAFAENLNWDSPECTARAWYVSEEKLEPRLGERFEEPIAEYEQPLQPARDAMRMLGDIKTYVPETPLAAFLLQHPEHRHTARRIQIAARWPYAEIRDNTIAHDMLPIDMLRCKLSFFGAGYFDPRSDRWVRINMFRNAPFPDDLANEDADNWTYPS